MKHTRTVVALTTALAATALLTGCGKSAATATDHMMAPSPSDTMMHSTTMTHSDTMSPSPSDAMMHSDTMTPSPSK